MHKLTRIILTALLLTTLSPAKAEEQQTLLGPVTGSSGVEIHGFMSQGYLRSTRHNFIYDSTVGTTDFAEAGLTLNKDMGNNLRVGMQLAARDYGRTGNYDAKFDWFLLDYRWKDWLGIRAGRIKLPFGLYNDTSDVDSARTAILLPQSVYPSERRDYLLAQTGVELYGFTDLGPAGSAEYRLYTGTIYLETPSTPGAFIEVQTTDVPYVHGGRVIWEPPVKGLRLGGSYQRVLINNALFISPPFNLTPKTNLRVDMAVYSIEYATRDFQFTTEYSRWWGDFDSNSPAILDATSVVHERYYGMLTVRAKEWLHPGVYYSVTIPNVENKDTRSDILNDAAIFVRLDLTPNWIFKLEGHYMDGTAGLDPQINGLKAPNSMERNWGLFLAKTTVFF